MILHNKYNKDELRKQLYAESFRRITLSFYRYVNILDTQQFRDDLYIKLSELGVFGRVYIASEGINAQISVPEHNFEAFKKLLNDNAYITGVNGSHLKINNIASSPLERSEVRVLKNNFEIASSQFSILKNVPLKIAVEDDGKSFYKLIVRIKNKIVADGLSDETFDVTNVGNHLSAREFNDAMQDPQTLVIDMRTHYESEVGHFENALCPDADTFRDALPKAIDLVKGKEDQKILLYCTGGIRCEKASSYFKHKGFKDVNQLYGGIIDYARQVKAENLETKFIGKNFVFDDRLGERITEDIISVCHQCQKPSDRHVNCANNDCHLLFIQCESCSKDFNGCCTPRCKDIAALPIEAQRTLRKGKVKKEAHAVYKSRLRPNLQQMLATLKQQD